MNRPTLFLNGIALAVLVSSAAARADELLVFAASSAQAPLTQLAEDFQARTGAVVRFSFAGSTTLARQICAGAPADLFLAADEASMDVAQKGGRVVAGTRADLLTNRLVVVASKSGALSAGQPKDLLNARRLAMADPRVDPLGLYAKAWLSLEGLWAALEPKVILALDSRAALRMVELSEADAAVAYLSDAVDSANTRLLYRVPLERTPSIRYPAAKLTHAQGPLADDFLRFLRESHARTVFSRHGFWVVFSS